jgi:hypothetical protein
VCAPVPKPRPRFCYLIFLLSVALISLRRSLCHASLFRTLILFGLWCCCQIFVFNLSCGRNLLLLVLCCLVALPFSAGNLRSCCRSSVITAEHGPTSFSCLKFSISPRYSVPSTWSPFCGDLFSTSSPPLFLLLPGRTALFLPQFRRRTSLLVLLRPFLRQVSLGSRLCFPPSRLRRSTPPILRFLFPRLCVVCCR